ncbi:MAG: hypothetical protein AAB368_04635, partial [bacterium]
MREVRAAAGPLRSAAFLAALLAGCGRGGPRFDLVLRLPAAPTSLCRLGDAVWVGSSQGLTRIPAGAGSNGGAETFGDAAGLAGPLANVRWVGSVDGDLILATGGGVARFSPSRRVVVRAWTAKEGLGHDSVRWAGSANGAVWAGTIRGASRLLPGGRRWRNYGAADGLPQTHVYRVFGDGKDLWASSINGGLCRFDPRRDRWAAVPTEHALGNKYIYA